MYKYPKRFFTRFLLVTLFTIVNIVLLVLFSSGGSFGLYVALILVILNAFLLIAFLLIAIINFFKYLFEKEKKSNDFIMHFINLLFALGVTFVFGLFYLFIIAGALVVLLPFLA